MNISHLVSLLIRRLWLILATGAFAAGLTFWLIGRQPKTYRAEAMTATGVINYKGITSSKNEGFVQEYMINNAFSNLLDFSRSRTTMKLLQIHLLKHDLAAMYNQEGTPMRMPNNAISTFTDEEGKHLLTELQKIDVESVTDPTMTPQMDNLLYKVSAAFRYDHDALSAQTAVIRKGATDYLNISATTESAQLSQFMANSYASIFTTYYGNLYEKEKRHNLDFYTRLANEKRRAVDSIQSQKFAYLYEKGLPAIGRQSEELIGQLSQLETARQRVEAEGQSAKESIMRLDYYLEELSNAEDKEATERIRRKREAERLNREVNELSRNQDKRGDLDKSRNDLEKLLSDEATTLGAPREDGKIRLQDDLYRDKIQADLRKVQAEAQQSKIQSDIDVLRRRLGNFVINDAVSTGFEAQQKRAEEEFARINEEMVKAKLELENAENPLYVIENAQKPSFPESRKRGLTSAFAGIFGSSLTAAAVFLMAFMDRSLRTPENFLVKSGNMHLLGPVIRVDDPGFDIRKAFTTASTTPELTHWQEQVRKIRSQLKAYEKQSVLFVSPRKGEGKTFLIMAIAQSIAANNQRVLVLDMNFKSPMPQELTGMPSGSSSTINVLLTQTGLDEIFKTKEKSSAATLVDVVGHHPIAVSPSEAIPAGKLQQFLEGALRYYDYVFLEAASMNDYVDAREILPQVDRFVAVFDARRPIDRGTYATLAYFTMFEVGTLIGSILNQTDPRDLA
jgi:uncharacterized protein involved in exopolysaccharide biosynthesis